MKEILFMVRIFDLFYVIFMQPLTPKIEMESKYYH